MSGSSRYPTRKPPSRQRYEESHPTVSCRVSLKTYRLLDKARQEESRSFTDIVKAGLGLLEARIEEKASIRKQASVKGYKKGCAEAERLYKVTYTCDVCGGIMAVTSDSEKAAVKEYMRAHRWGHTSCHEKRR